MTSGCYPGVSRLYQHSSSRPAHNFRRKEVGTAAYLGVVAVPEICQKTCRNFHRKEAGTAAYLGVVAVPRDMTSSQLSKERSGNSYLTWEW